MMMISHRIIFIITVLCVASINCQFWKTNILKDLFSNGSQFIENYITAERHVVKLPSFTNKDSAVKTIKKGCNADAELTTPQLIAKYGYPSESHTVITEDGYILTLHRIPREGGRVVLLHHGLLGSSADWVLTGPRHSLAMILWDAGYDVWMGNARGNTYSRAHVDMSSSDPAFWDFSFHEIGYYDLPADINHINTVTKSKGDILYVGHSMGTSILFVLLSTRPEYNEMLKAGFALAPIAYLSDVRSPIRYLAPFTNDIKFITELIGADEFLPQNIFIKWLARHICEKNNYEKIICENVMFVLCGYDKQQFNISLLPTILSHTPAGASTKTIIHYGQIIKYKGQFQMFDYGDSGNFNKYGQKDPPKYFNKNISLPIAFFVAENDWLSSIVDSKVAYQKLHRPIEFYKVPLSHFNHLDFIWGTNVKTLLYDKIISLMKNYST